MIVELQTDSSFPICARVLILGWFLVNAFIFYKLYIGICLLETLEDYLVIEVGVRSGVRDDLLVHPLDHHHQRCQNIIQ